MDATALVGLGFAAFLVGYVTERTMGFNLDRLLSVLGFLVVVLPFAYLAFLAPSLSAEEVVNIWTAYFVVFVEGLPAVILGGIGGFFADSLVVRPLRVLWR